MASKQQLTISRSKNSSNGQYTVKRDAIDTEGEYSLSHYTLNNVETGTVMPLSVLVTL